MLTLKPLSPDDCPQVVAHSQTVGWDTPPAYAYQILKTSGKYAFAIFHEQQIVATALATPYEGLRAWVGMVITHPDYQKQGLGRRLMDHLVAVLWADGFQQIMLDASKAGQALYATMGFRPLYAIYRLRRPSDFPAPQMPSHVHLATDLAPIVRLDASAFGVSRPQFYPAFGISYAHADGQGFIMVQTWRENSPSLGAWVHATPQGAADLLRAMLHRYHGQTIGVTTANDQARLILASYGFDVVNVCTRMVLGSDDPLIQRERYFGSVSMAVG